MAMFLGISVLSPSRDITNVSWYFSVESVVEKEGTSLVTIKGHNTKASGDTGFPSYCLPLDEDGIAIVTSLDDATTEMTKRREKLAQSLEQGNCLLLVARSVLLLLLISQLLWIGF